DGAPLLVDDPREPVDQLDVGRLDEHVDLAAARETDLERDLVGDPVREKPWASAREHLLRGAVHVVLDAAAGDRAGELAARRDAELGADRPRRRAARGDDGGK